MKASINVIGDIMIDKYTFGNISRLNPEEAGAPSLLAQSEEYRLGGAANVAANISNLGIQTKLIGVIGKDFEGQTVKKLLENNKIELHAILHENPTILKERFMFHGRQIARVDKEKYNDLGMSDIASIITFIKNNLSNILVFSDYGKGIAHPELLADIKKIASANNIKIIADVKPNNIDIFDGVYLIKPNFKEFCGMVGNVDMDVNNIVDIEKYGQELAKKLHTNLVITKGAHGVSLIPLDGDIIHLNAIDAQVIDVTGAGDSFLAGLAYGLNTGMSLQDSVMLGNKASGAVVGRLGTAVVQPLDIK